MEYAKCVQEEKFLILKQNNVLDVQAISNIVMENVNVWQDMALMQQDIVLGVKIKAYSCWTEFVEVVQLEEVGMVINVLALLDQKR